MKQEVHNAAVITGGFNTQLSTIDWTNRQKSNKEIEDLNNTTNQLDLRDIYRTFHPITAEYTFFSSAP